jgi:DNA invertase Pin-like site-specific DNA recombinase
MNCKIAYTDEDQDQIQVASDLQKEKGIRVTGYYASSNHRNTMKLLDNCLEEKISNLVVFELTLFGDRLDRIIKMLSTFFAHGIQIDLYSKGKIISLNSFSCFNEELLLILFLNLGSSHKSKIKNGQRIAKLNGKKIGRKPISQKNEICELRSSGFSLREINQRTGVSLTTIWRHTREY